MLRYYFLPFLLLSLSASTSWGDTCTNRGELSGSYCDNNHDLVADTPNDPKDLIDPNPLIISITPNEDPLSYANEMEDFYQYLEICLNRRVISYPLQSSEAEIDAMKNGRIHVASFSSGITIVAVNKAGAVPFAAQGNIDGIFDTNMLLIVRSDSPYKSLNDLKGKRIAHVNMTSNTGHFAALALLPNEGLTPYTDYQVLFSGKHNRSIMGVKSGDYDAAIIASEVLDRMVTRKDAAYNDFRILYKSDSLPSAPFSYAHNLTPALQEQLKSCFFAYQFSPKMTKAFLNADRYIPISYKESWEIARKISSKLWD